MNSHRDWITSPDDPKLRILCGQIRDLSRFERGLSTDAVSASIGWPAEQLELLGNAGVYRWFIPESQGGLGWSSSEIVSGYIQLSAACLTTTFILTQRVAAIRRICVSQNVDLRDRLLPGLITGSESATVGISHLTTSRQHIGKPALLAVETDQGYILNGFSPWVTGAANASHLVLGAALANGQQLLLAVSSNADGVTVKPGFRLVALSASETGAVGCVDVKVLLDQVLAGPVENVLTSGNATGSAPGGFQTSSLAIGLAQAAIEFIADEVDDRPELSENFIALKSQLSEIQQRLLQLVDGVPVCTTEELRTEANSLVLRATQSALVAAKGAGYVTGHPVGRWCQEALFFLVWSCPQSVLNANLCELAGIEGI